MHPHEVVLKMTTPIGEELEVRATEITVKGDITKGKGSMTHFLYPEEKWSDVIKLIAMMAGKKEKKDEDVMLMIQEHEAMYPFPYYCNRVEAERKIELFNRTGEFTITNALQGEFNKTVKPVRIELYKREVDIQCQK